MPCDLYYAFLFISACRRLDIISFYTADLYPFIAAVQSVRGIVAAKTNTSMVRSFCFVTPYYAIAATFLPHIVSRKDLYFVENKIIYFYMVD